MGLLIPGLIGRSLHNVLGIKRLVIVFTEHHLNSLCLVEFYEQYIYFESLDAKIYHVFTIF